MLPFNQSNLSETQPGFWLNICSTDIEVITMPKFFLGELEEMILLLVSFLNGRAYGVLIVEEMQKQAGREITISAVHAVLHRLEEKGFVRSSMGGASTERGGRRKRIFEITAHGLQVIEELRDTRNLIWSQIAKNSTL
jgi:DNA-binding PadR family transcriptional regulator